MLSSCSKIDNNGNKPEGVYSAVYRISGRAIVKDGERETALEGIRVEMLPDKGEIVEQDEPANVDITDADGQFCVEVRSSNVKDEKLILKFTDPAGAYEDRKLILPLQDVGFEDGDGLLFLGTYSEENICVEMKRKRIEKDPVG